MRTATAHIARIVAVLLLCAAFALPALAIEPGQQANWLGRISAQAYAAVQRLLTFVPGRENSEPTGPPAAFCGHIDPDGCAQGETPPPETAGPPAAFCGHIDPFGCAEGETPPPEPVADPETGRFCGDIDTDGCAAP